MTDFTLLAAAAAIGVAAGLHAAIWGMYKDSPHEGFYARRFVRSPLLAGVLAPLIAWRASLSPFEAGAAVVLFGVTYGIERAIAESYKTFFRSEDQSKYAIPMQLAVFGRPVQSRAARWAFGAAYVGAIVGGIWFVDWLQRSVGPRQPIFVAATVGALGGWYSAFGGAWKDAPIEGFQIFKFFRSPLLAALWAFLLLQLTDRWALVMMGAIGFTVATTESYKTFFFPSKPRGKFAGKPVLYPRMLVRRNWLVPVYVAIWLGVVAAIAAALTG